ncbi:hypothetical protein BCR37DRAFT_377865 [Protomyces lactucae-debilis]|uniref:Uncharacterized protein n=1 Tax=Protomyces lactucae-debilis TaxID=2754530 RepID=A0A1Y2FLV9_PROLT|nr:uncharacterized protein BCR37DRAFT_377865 [Protomyces lactucae-debilis]ORY84950.1 hypothetical protein BCR37DRAFT_377865 [Protomyces lactucae-debilis]
MTSDLKSSRGQSEGCSARKSGRTSKLSRKAQDAEPGSTSMSKVKTAAKQAKKAAARL